MGWADLYGRSLQPALARSLMRLETMAPSVDLWHGQTPKPTHWASSEAGRSGFLQFHNRGVHRLPGSELKEADYSGRDPFCQNPSTILEHPLGLISAVLAESFADYCMSQLPCDVVKHAGSLSFPIERIYFFASFAIDFPGRAVVIMSSPGAGPVIASQWVLITIAAVVIIARLNLRVRIQRRTLLRSDFLMCAAWFCALFCAGFNVALAELGALNKPVKATLQGYEGTPEHLILVLKMFFASSIPFYTTFYLCRAALLDVYLQAFPKFLHKRRMFLWAVVVFTACAYTASILMIFLICLPVRRNWSIMPQDACPVNTVRAIFRVTWGLLFIGDVLVFMVPWMIIPGLQMRRSLKMGIYATFGLGIINIAVSITRFVEVEKGARAQYDVSLSLVEFFSSLDVNLGLVIACLPSLRPYFNSNKGSNPSTSLNSFPKPMGKPNEKGFREITNDVSSASRGPRVPTPQDNVDRMYGLSPNDRIDSDEDDARTRSGASDIELVAVDTHEMSYTNDGSKTQHRFSQYQQDSR
ncbi:hypothetical protein G7046_g6458 [Stylonectria norvegica]|nr:hypothetical protein G7046_g6458 [Stylonectria norvegica]